MECDAEDSNGRDVGPYSVVFAIGGDDRDDEYRLRHAVFVEECGFEPPRADRMERDEFDEASCSLLLRNAMTGELAACQRLILPDRLPAATVTNLERVYRPREDGIAIDFNQMPRDAWAEASRTTVAKPYRWGNSRTLMPAMLAIKYASIALAVVFGRTTLFSLSEPATARLIRRLGFDMVQVGALVDFHGARAPFRMDVDAMARSVHGADRQTLDRLVNAASALNRAGRGSGGDPVRTA